jgi:hypothetical protein
MNLNDIDERSKIQIYIRFELFKHQVFISCFENCIKFENKDLNANE